VVIAATGGAAAGQAASPSLIVFSADRAPFFSGQINRTNDYDALGASW
jgi:hypothetical protein